jgi:pimeloyl-ACP methyl ester carboxylesterase
VKALKHNRIDVGDVFLHTLSAGDGPPVILLHGFPENANCWRHQIEPLARAGFSVFAPDLRGYNRSDIPPDRRAYRLPRLVGDIVGLIRATGAPRAHVVGHDWGGVITWSLAAEHPDLVDKVVVLNAPHPELFLRHVRRPRQLLRSWYAMFFQLPLLPEWILSAHQFRIVRQLFTRNPARKGAFTAGDIDGYVEALERPGALTAALNYYRANMGFARGALRPPAWPMIRAQTLVVWGEQDTALGAELLEGLDRLVPGVQIHRIPDAGHWVQNEAPDEVNRVLTEFLTA